MDKRNITNTNCQKFNPFNNFGTLIIGMSWHKISFNEKTNFETYLSKLTPETKILPHKKRLFNFNFYERTR